MAGITVGEVITGKSFPEAVSEAWEAYLSEVDAVDLMWKNRHRAFEHIDKKLEESKARSRGIRQLIGRCSNEQEIKDLRKRLREEREEWNRLTRIRETLFQNLHGDG